MEQNIIQVKADKVCAVCRKEKSVQRHHIVFNAYGGDNSKENIVMLCRKCHDKYHKQIPKKSNSIPFMKKNWDEWFKLNKRIKLCGVSA